MKKNFKAGPERKSNSQPFDKEKKEFSDKPNQKKQATPEPVKDGSMRLNRYIAHAGICSRREADKLISAGDVKINNKVVTEMGTKVMPGDEVKCNGKVIQGEQKKYLLLNKPKDYISTMDDPSGRKTVVELVDRACPERIYPVGRLDRATTGLLLFTNDGEMTKKLTHPSSKVKKVYQVAVDKNVTQKDLFRLVEGIELEDGISHVDQALYARDGADKKVITLDLHSGKNRVIRRLMESLGYKVLRLDRIQFAGLTKKDVPRGRFRFLSDKEIGFLHRIAGIKQQS